MLFLVLAKTSAPGSMFSMDDRPQHLPYEARALLGKHERGRGNMRNPEQLLDATSKWYSSLLHLSQRKTHGCTYMQGGGEG